ncbi:DUF6204 family protein [uncultured Ilumatobacter sp.]|uniref:DUF6204 family protein n=1 Tax=uncultured Ilumatobacter sp. TaxID=879968 RepID=UPI00374F2E3B
MTKIYRAVVRGHFSDLDDATRAALTADAGRHTYFDSAFTAEGTFTYEPQLVAFNLRYEMRFVPDNPSDPGDTTTDPGVETAAMQRAIAWLGSKGYGHKHLTVSVIDMASMWR